MGREAAERRLRDASVLVIGVGALGCAAAETLAATGVGRLSSIPTGRALCGEIAGRASDNDRYVIPIGR